MSATEHVGVMAPRLADWRAPRSKLWQLFRDELTLSRPRTFRMFRMTALVMLVIVISMALRVPNAALSTYMIFFVSKADVATTARIGIGGLLGVTIAILLSFVFYSVAFSEPAVRLPLMACSAFLGMYFLRTSPAGVLGMLIGFITTYALTLIDGVPSPEVLTRELLWTWVIIAYPIALLVLFDFVFGRRAAQIFQDGVAARLQAAGQYLGAGFGEDGAARGELERFDRLGMDDLSIYAKAGPPASAPIRAALLDRLEFLLLLTREFPAEAKRNLELMTLLRQAGEACLHAKRALLGEDGAPPKQPATIETGSLENPSTAARGTSPPLLDCIQDIARTIHHLRNPRALVSLVEQHGKAPPPSRAEAAAKKTEAIHFALKVTLAAMTAYLIYTGVAFSGIHTALITCFFVAQDNLGATIHKLSLRILGAVIGGALGIGAIVFVLPHLDSAGGLAVLTGAVMLPAAWIATGSELISYMGLQMAFAFCLTVLQGFSRTTNMATGRDRMIGILLGNVLMSVVFTYLWPVRLKPSIRQALSRSVEALAAMVRLDREKTSPADLSRAEAAFRANLDVARKQARLARLEPGEDDRSSLIPEIESLFVPIHVISQTAGALPASAKEALRAVADPMTNWLSDLARSFTAELPIPAFHQAEPAVQRLKGILNDSDEGAGGMRDLQLRYFWLERLSTRIQQLANSGSEHSAEGAVS